MGSMAVRSKVPSTPGQPFEARSQEVHIATIPDSQAPSCRARSQPSPCAGAPSVKEPGEHLVQEARITADRFMPPICL